MIAARPPSLQRPYDDFWSGDSAFQQPDTKDPESIKAYADKIKQAKLTGDWSQLAVEGRVPTKFVMQPVKGEQLRWIGDRTNVSDAEKAMGHGVSYALAFRCAVREIHNLPFPFELKFVDHPNLGLIADSNVVNMFDQVDPGIVQELGMFAVMKARDLDPL